MIEFDFKGINIEARVEMIPHDYLDGDIRYNRQRTRFDRNVKVFVQFWEFRIHNGNLYELAFIKSTLNYFIHSCWKRSIKEGGKIDLDKALFHESSYVTPSSLHFVARQKDNKHFLHIFLRQDGNVKECYLDLHEVTMLDIAIGKIISLLTPKVVEAQECLF